MTERAAKRWSVIVTCEELSIGKTELRIFRELDEEDRTLLLSADRVEVLVALWFFGEDRLALLEDIDWRGFDSAIFNASDGVGFPNGKT